jgi:hypothetical protein
MEKEFILGKMVENMKVNIILIKNRDMGHIYGLTGVNMKDIGQMV